MIGDLNRLVLAENLLHCQCSVGALVNLNSIPLKPTDFPTKTNDIRLTTMRCQLKYSPREVYGEKHYLLLSDLLTVGKGTVRFESYEELQMLSEKNKALQFIVRWAEIDEDLLNVIKEMPGGIMCIPINAKKYAKYLRETFREEVGEFVFTTEMMNAIERARTESHLELRKKMHRERSKMDRERKRRNK